MLNNAELPSLIDQNKFRNIKDFIDCIYDIFKEDFSPNSPKLSFCAMPIMARNKILNCSNCGNKCNNTLFDCKICPFIEKLDIFQHICSDEDKNLKVLPKYKRKNNRTPGIYNRVRASKVKWLKYMIENYQNEEIIRYYNKKGPDGKLNHYFWLFKEHYILILVEEKNSLFIRTCYDIKSDSDERKHYAYYMKYKKALEKECT